jgi:hypothetical protein
MSSKIVIIGRRLCVVHVDKAGSAGRHHGHQPNR